VGTPPTIKLKDGIVLVGSDLHIWPGVESVALRGFKKFCKELKPSAVILNGDVLDFPQISRHPPINWEDVPSPLEEIEAAQYHLHAIEQAAPKGCRKIWTLGNHDARFEMRLAAIAREYRGLKGVHLSDHFNPCWEKGWSCEINASILVKHRWKGGVHAAYNNTLHSGWTTVTGHLHRAGIYQLTDKNGTRWGVDTGCMAEVGHPAFEYTEDNPKSWVSAFGVFTFKDGELLWPELVTKYSEDAMLWRGKIIKV